MLNNPVINNAIRELCHNRSNEVCGYVLDNEVIESPNTSDDPEAHFSMAFPEKFDAIFHSHPNGPFYPTLLDMRQQLVVDKPWAICAFDKSKSEVFWFGDGLPKADLLRRPFRHGVTDCYELIRDFFQEKHGISLKSFPRDWAWWEDGESLYEKGFRVAGFEEVAIADVLPGDVLMANVRSKTPNHAAIYLGNDLILHHVTGTNGYDPYRLPKVEPAHRWSRFFSKAVRYEDAEIDRTVGQGVRF